MARFADKKQLYGLAAAFAVVAGVFIVAAALTQRSAADIDAEVVDLRTNSLPSVTHLAAARTDGRRIRRELDALSVAGPAGRAEIVSRIAWLRGALEAEIHTYETTPWYAGERLVFDESLRPELARFDATLDRLRADSDAADGVVIALRDLDAFDDSLGELLDLNNRQAYAATARILGAREHSARVALLLESASAILAVVAAALALRASRRLQLLMKRNADLQVARAGELEAFAHRVAHDLLSPISAVSFSLGAITRQHPDEVTRATVQRATRSIDRVSLMVHGIFDFARAGARPVPGARARLDASVRAAVEDLLAAEAESPPSVSIEPFEDCDVACDEAVLGVVLSNLLGNAAKYTRGSPERSITIRARGLEERVRIEIEDTGPGLAPELVQTIFEPYVRAPGVTQPGLGLGLATVKRVVVSHGGTVGAGRGRVGASFWFELPATH
jgi:signal transduction histidine kinase